MQKHQLEQHFGLSMVLLGKTGAGKSATGNTILGRQAFISKKSAKSVTQDVAVASGSVCGFQITVYDTPGFCDTELSEDKIQQTIQSILQECETRPCVYLLVIKADRFTAEEQNTVKKIEKLLGQRRLQKTWILFTRGDELEDENMTIEDFIKETEPLKKQIQKYDGRYHLFNNKKKTSGQVGMLVGKLHNELGKLDLPEIRDDVRIVLLGKTGVGKSATGNTILNRQAFISEVSFESVTSECQKQTAEINNRLITVIDTPGLFDTESSHEEIKREMMNCISMILPGPHVFLLLVSLGRFTQEESTSVKIIQEMFGENSLMFTMVLFTRGDQLRNKTIEECLGKPGSGIRNLLEECGNRYHVFNNNLTEDQTQVSLLLEKIDDMVKANGGSYYSSKIFREMEREKQQQQIKKLKERIEQLSREKEEHERQKREDNEKMRERERKTWTEQRLKEEREEMQRGNEKIIQQEISAYRRLETEYSNWTWSLCSAMMEIENKLQNQIEDKSIHEIEERDLQRELMEKSEEVKKSMSDFFEKDTDRDILIQWKTSFEIKIIELKESIVRETKRKLNVILQQRDLKRKIDAQRTQHENTLLEKSKELALKLKDKANYEEILKREFDLFWEECVKKITRDTPPIKDIDILRDVKEILSDNYKHLPVDTRNNNRNIFIVQNYSDYIQIKRSIRITEHFVKVFKSDTQNFISLETQIRILVNDIADQIDRMIWSFNISKMGYNKCCIQALIGNIKSRITDYEEESVKYVFKNEFFIDLVFSIFKRAEKTFTDQHRVFREVNDPVLYLMKKRDEYYMIFQRFCRGATSAVIFVEIICQKLKELIEQSLYKQTVLYLADEVRSNCPSLSANRSNLEKHILKRLAVEEKFVKYMNYIHNPRDHFKSFIRDEVSQYIRDQFSIKVQHKINQNIKVLQKKIQTAAHESTEDVQVKSGDVDLWLKFFTQKLSDDLIFSVKYFSGLKHNDVDFKLLEDVIKKELPSIMSDISREFSTDTFNKKLDLNKRPDEILIDHLCQCCWVQCPFCKATCTNTLEDHEGDHSVPFHRVDGANGTYYSGTTNLSASICTAEVASDKNFNTSDGKRVLYRDYRKAGGVYANWSITPDLSELPYWKWFVCRFQKELEKYYNKTFQGKGKIPDEWRRYTKQDAIESLDKYI